MLRLPCLRPLTRPLFASQVAAGPLATPAPHNPMIISRGKRTKGKSGALSPGQQRLVTLLSVMSMRKKQPRRLNLCFEDIIRHETVSRAWSILLRQKREGREAQLKAQYAKIEEACNELQAESPYLAFEATKREKGKRFTPELRPPTESPANEIWQFKWAPRE